MNTFGCGDGFSKRRWQSLVSLLSVAVLCAVGTPQLSAMQDAPATAQGAQAPPTRNRLPSSCSAWSRRLRSTRIRWSRRSWQRPRFPSKS